MCQVKERFNLKLTNNSIARIKLMEKFEEAITGIKISDVAVIGGTRDEPELRAIKKYNPNLIVKFYGLETDDIFFNLNQNPHYMINFLYKIYNI